MTTEKKFLGGCLNCNFETTNRAELKAHNCTETMESTWDQFQKELQEMKDFPTVEEVLKATQATAPKGWTVSHEYPDSIGVTHSSLTDDQFIMFGDINGFFAFNDEPADIVCGSFEELTDADEIAESFWQKIAEIYPDLVKGE